jgi:hypothetical protein
MSHKKVRKAAAVKMKNKIQIKCTGEVHKIIQESIVDKFNNLDSSKENIFCLNEEITFIVCDLRIANGNLNKFSKSAWLCNVSEVENQFNVDIKF